MTASEPEEDSDALFGRSPDVLCDPSGDRVMLMRLDTGAFYTMNGSAGRIWDLLENPMRASEIVQAMSAAFDVEPARCDADVRAMLRQMREEGLVHLADPEPARDRSSP